MPEIRKLRRDAGQAVDSFHNKVFRDFGGLNTQAHRQAIQPNEFAWLENIMPVGHGNALILPAISAALASVASGTCYNMKGYNLAGVNYMFMVTTTGHAYQVRLDSPHTVTEITNPGSPEFGTNGVSIDQWKNERIMISDPTNGLFDWDGTTLTPPGRIISIEITTGGIYTAIPAISFAGGGGAGAAASALMGINGTQTISAAGLGYVVDDILTLVGGTFTTPGKLRVTTIGGGGTVTGVAVFDPGNYSVLGAAPLAVTGGSGNGLATITPSYAVFGATITNPGTSPYTSPPTVIFSAGNATATANLMSAPANPSGVACFASRVWVSVNRTLVYSAPGTYNDFTGPGSGSTIFTDSTLHSNIRGLLAANNFLYVVGLDSVNAIGDVQVNALGQTVFSNTNLTASVGTPFGGSAFAYYRSILFMNASGIYALSGSTPVKISDALDGIFPNINLNGAVCGATVMLANNLCAAFSFAYVVNGVSRTLLAIFFNKKWFLASQGTGLLVMASGTSDVFQNLYATDGTSLFQLFEDADTPVDWTLQTAFWDMDDVTKGKQATSFAFEIDSSNIVGTVNVNIDAITKDPPYVTSQAYAVAITRPVTWQNNLGNIVQWQNNALAIVDWTAGGYVLNMQDGSNFGKYLGITMQADDVIGVVSSAMLRFIYREDW